MEIIHAIVAVITIASIQINFLLITLVINIKAQSNKKLSGFPKIFSLSQKIKIPY